MKHTITIGIPAYNEESNIGFLLKELQKQIEESYSLEKIIVISDGSTDKTVEIVNSINNSLVKIINGTQRRGLAARQNQIIDNTQSDILIILNSDIRIPDRYFIEHLIQPIIKAKADLVTPEYKQLLPNTFFERVLYRSNELKTAIYEEFRGGKNVYTCCGPARAFSKRLYTKLRFKDSSNEDAYSYMFTVLNGFTYDHIHDTAVYFKLPSNLPDHSNQSTRFFNSKERLIKEFGSDNIKRNYDIPHSILVQVARKYAVKYPLEIGLYGCILAYTWLKSQMNKKSQNIDLWEPTKSSKKLSS